MSRFRFASTSLRTIVVALLVVACGDSPSGPKSDQLGTYVLSSVNGAVAPWIIYGDEYYQLEITRAYLTLNAEGACRSSMSMRVTEKATSTVSAEEASEVCSYSIRGSTLTVTVDGEAYTATISGGTIRVSLEGDVLVYRK